MEKICVFCGKKPEIKNKEHVLPQWLLNITGNPNRIVNFGYNYSSDEVLKFDWKNFTVPSCTKCNEKFSEFEGKIKLIVEKLQRGKEITGKESLDLFDWLDKVRIGLWLNYYFLEKNKSQITPNLCINNRIGKKDRFLQIHFVESKINSSGLNAFGVETFVFQFNPSCFGLRINNLLIINGSNDFLISKNCGFPYPQTIESNENGMLALSDWKYNRSTHPYIENLNLHKGVLTLMQPIQTQLKNLSFYYSDHYLIANCLNPDKRIGKVFRVDNESLIPINNLSNKLKFEPVTKDEIKFLGQLVAKIYQGQNVFLQRAEAQNIHFEQAIEINNETIKHYENLVKTLPNII
jgi:hypothetical protein